MINHWSAIGIYSQKELSQMIDLGLKYPSSQFQDKKTGRTYLLTDNFAELWVHIDAKCAVPSFASSTIIKAKVTKWIENENSCPYCAMLCVDVLDKETDYKLYPIAITFGNVALARQSVEIGKTINFHLAVFIESCQSWDSIESYKQQYPERKLGLGWFIPLGPFSPLEKLKNNQPRAAFFGIVKEVQRKKNPWTNNYYQHLLLECADKTYECVAEHEKLKNIFIGNLVYVESWLCAKLINT
ncbi:hypothetical protein [Crocosphaera chwakensis]|uniref:Uncharacterized protein n=1 Tax=Crocosphaera chwakensis CCY0110 TaxID=391612 RepID=A3IK22_9CHRO|nr:hypothetical protein [Crocosphaera chwakensis]EAZ93011.1 hypothetical protein CY0110_03044 [Crocosphaera chwakensis CCY0110]